MSHSWECNKILTVTHIEKEKLKRLVQKLQMQGIDAQLCKRPDR